MASFEAFELVVKEKKLCQNMKKCLYNLQKFVDGQTNFVFVYQEEKCHTSNPREIQTFKWTNHTEQLGCRYIKQLRFAKNFTRMNKHC